MDEAQRVLFGGFPRSIGISTPEIAETELVQNFVHSEGEMDYLIDQCQGNNNLYSSLSIIRPGRIDGEFKGCMVISDKVSFDLDAHEEREEHFPDGWRAFDKLREMRKNEEIASQVLGEVVRDMKRLAQYALENNIPSLGVFTGFGVHVHLLYRPTKRRTEDRMHTTAKKIEEEIGLESSDEAVIGQATRIMRIPNIERMDGSKPTGVYTVPLTRREMLSMDAHELMKLSVSPRPEISLGGGERGKMGLWEDYLGSGKSEDTTSEDMRPIPEDQPGDELAKHIIRRTVQMPCVYEHAFGPNPLHDIRVKLGIMLLNAGFSVDDGVNLLRKLRWVDWDEKVTRKQLESLRKSKKGDFSCKTMQSKGYCTRADDKEGCPTYGYIGGNTP